MEVRKPLQTKAVQLKLILFNISETGDNQTCISQQTSQEVEEPETKPDDRS